MTYGVAYTEIKEVLRNVHGTKPPYTIHFIIPRFGSLLLQVCSDYLVKKENLKQDFLGLV